MSGSSVAPDHNATTAAASTLQRGYLALTQLASAIINIPHQLFTAPAPDYAQASLQARQAGLVATAEVAELMALIRHRLQQPEALALMRPAAEDYAFGSLSRWLPELAQPLVTEDQLAKITDFIFKQPAWEAITAAGRCSALVNLLVDEIHQAAAQQQQGLAQRALPELLRLKLVSDMLQRAHPLLPTVLWAAQVLWQIRQLGVLNALDAELKLQLIQWMMAIDGPQSRQALSDRTLWHQLNGWIEQRLEDLRFSSTLAQPQDCPPAVALRADGWQVNSELNTVAAAGDELLVKVSRCYELIKPLTQPLNLAIGCPLASENGSQPLTEWQGGAQFSRGLGRDETGNLWLSLQLESGNAEFALQGVEHHGTRQRPLTLTPLAGGDDQLVLLEPPAGSGADAPQNRLLSAMIDWSAHQLKREEKLTERIVTVSTWRGNVKTAVKSPGFRPGWLHLARRKTAPAKKSQSGGSAWPLAGAAAQVSGQGELQKISQQPPASVAGGISAEDFYASLQFKYQQQLTQYPQVMVTLNHNGVIRDRQYPLLQALQVVFEASTDSPQLTLQFHPEWSTELREEVSHFLLRNYAPDLNPLLPMDWESVDNHYAAWLTGVGLARRGMDKMAEIIEKMQSPVWDVARWIEDNISTMVKECGGDPRIITGATQIGVGVRLPSGSGRQHLPIPLVAGSWQSVGNYTLQDILTREYLRGNYRYESLEFIFPPEINQQLRKRIIETDIQKKYIVELSQALSEGDVKEGILSLFKTLYHRAIDAWCLRSVRHKAWFEVSSIRNAMAAGQVYYLKLHGYPLNNLIFIAADYPKGLIVALWGEKSWEVNIDLTGYISFYDQSQAEDLQNFMYESLPIKGRSENAQAAISLNQIQINFSGHYKIDFKGKAWMKKTWVEPLAERSIVSLVKSNQVERDLLISFISTLLSDMDYLVKSNAEHIRDSAIEVLTTMAWMISMYAIPTLGIQVAGASASAAKLVGAVTSWKSSLAFSGSLCIFPNLVKGISSDRHKEAQKAWLDAVLGLLGEGGGMMLSNLCPRVLTGMFKQGSKVIKVSIDQIPPATLQKINGHIQQTFSAYQAEIARVYGLAAQQPQTGQTRYAFSFDAKRPAPTSAIEHDLTAFPAFIARYHQDLLTTPFDDPLKLPSVLQQFLQSRRYQVEIGGLVQWSSISDVATRYHYLVRARAPASAQNPIEAETENTILDFFPERYDPRDINGIFITDEKHWLAGLSSLPQNSSSAISVQWFSTLENARAQYLALRTVETEMMAILADQMITRPDWYHKTAKKRALKEIDDQQETLRKEIYLLEENINFRSASPNTLSLKLSELYASGKLQPYDLMGKKLNILANNPVSKRAVPLPDGNYRLIGTDLRGIYQSSNGDVTLTDFGSPATLLQQQRIQSYFPDQLAAAGRAAEISAFYAPKVDDYLIENSLAGLPVPQMRVRLLDENTRWLGRSARHIKAPLIIAVNHTLAAHGAENNNQLGATLPAEAILFVLAPDDMIRQVSNILGQLRAKPIPVSPLLIEDAPQLNQLIMLAESYALLPQAATNREMLQNSIYQPWLPIIDMQASAGFIDAAEADMLRKQTSADNYDYFLGDAPRRVTSRDDISRAQPGARMVLTDVEAGPGKAPFSHAMLMLNDGAAVGGNNEIIGGREAWQKIYLLNHNWIDDKKHGFVLKAAGSKFSLHIQTSSAPPQPTLMPEGDNLAREIWQVISLAYEQLNMLPQSEGERVAEGLLAWDAVIELYQQAGLFNPETARRMREATTVDRFQTFLGDSAQLARSWPELFDAVPGSRLAFIEKTVSRTRLVHAMILTYGGYAVGLNNNVLGGEAGWGKIHLGGLQFSPDTRKGLVIEVGERRFNCLIIPPWN